MKIQVDVNLVFVDSEDSLLKLYDNDLLYITKDDCFVLHTEAIVKKLSELDYWKKLYTVEKSKTMELTNKIKELEKELQNSKFSVNKDRDRYGRFTHGHKVDHRKRDSKGRFIKKI